MSCSLVSLLLQLHVSSAFEPEVSTFDPKNAPFKWYVLATNENTYTVNAQSDRGYYGSFYSSNDFGINWYENSNAKIETVAGAPNKIRYGDLFHISFDGGLTFQKVPRPSEFTKYDGWFPPRDIFVGHPTQNDWLIYNAETCDSNWKHCSKSSYVTTNRGANWTVVKSGGQGFDAHCYFVTAGDYVVYCEGYDDYLHYTPNFQEDAPVNISAQYPFGVDAEGNFVIKRLYHSVGNYVQENQTAVSRDGINFRRAQLPPQLTPNSEKLRILNGSSDFLLATYGDRLLRSGKLVNEFTVVLDKFDGVFDKIPSMEEVYIANVHSPNKSMISHDGGTTWKPVIGPNGQELLLHLDHDANAALVNAAGVYIAVGNIREQDNIHSTYMTRDAGVSWFQINKKAALWAVAEQGSVIAMVVKSRRDFSTDRMYYTFDQGQSWQEYNWGFKAYAEFLIGSPDGGGSQFILTVESVEDWEKNAHNSGPHNNLFSLNFATNESTYCDASDFEIWEPEYPELTSKCILGQKTVYRRRIRDRECLIGSYFKENKLSEIKETCECTRADYECDYTHELDSTTNECKPIAGAHMPTQKEQCVNGAISWKKFSGYRKIAATSCHGDPIEDSTRRACPGKEKEFRDGVFDVDPTLMLKRRNKTLIVFMWIGISLVIVAVIITLLLVILYRHRIKNAFNRASMDTDNTSTNPSLWQRFKARLPIFGSHISDDSLGFYNRVDHEERNRIVETYSDLDDSQNDEDAVASNDESN